MATGCNLEVAQLRSERRVVEKNLARDFSKRCAALGLVFTHLHFAPARWADLGTKGARGHSDSQLVQRTTADAGECSVRAAVDCSDERLRSLQQPIACSEQRAADQEHHVGAVKANAPRAYARPTGRLREPATRDADLPSARAHCARCRRRFVRCRQSARRNSGRSLRRRRACGTTCRAETPARPSRRLRTTDARGRGRRFHRRPVRQKPACRSAPARAGASVRLHCARFALVPKAPVAIRRGSARTMLFDRTRAARVQWLAGRQRLSLRKEHTIDRQVRDRP